MPLINEDLLENNSLEWFKEIGYSFVHGPDISPDGNSPDNPNQPNPNSFDTQICDAYDGGYGGTGATWSR